MKTKDTLGSLNLYRKIAVSFFVLTTLLLLVVLYLSFSQATIVITAEQGKISKELTLNVQGEATSDLSGIFLEKNFSIDGTFPATGMKVISTEVGGKAIIINNYSRSQPLLSTTRLLSENGLLFRTKERVIAPAGGRVEVNIYADNPSLENAIGPSKFIIPGLWPGLQDKIYAVSQAPMKKLENSIKVATDRDIAQAKSALAGQIKTKALADFQSQLAAQGITNENVIIVQIPAFAGASASVPISIGTTADRSAGKGDLSGVVAGQQGEAFKLSGALNVQGVAIPKANLSLLLQSRLATSLASDQLLSSVDLNSIDLSLVQFNVDTKEATIKAAVSGQISLQPESIDKEKLIGLSKDEAIAYFKSFPTVKDVTITFSPFWVRRVPAMMNHIKLIIQ